MTLGKVSRKPVVEICQLLAGKWFWEQDTVFWMGMLPPLVQVEGFDGRVR